MQGESSSVESLPETFEFDHGSSSNNSGLDQQIYWDNMLSHVETQSLPNYLLPPSDANNSYMNMDSQDNASLSIWNSDRPSSSEHPLNQGGHDETKMEHEWTSLTINPGGRPRIEERRVGGRRFDAASMLSLENVNINLNSVQVDDAEIFSQNSHMNEVLQNPEHNAAGGAISSEVSESGLCPHPISGILKFEHAPSSSDSSNACINSSGVGFMSVDVDDRPGSSLDGRRIACKRKNIEGFTGQSSASGSSNSFEQTESSLLHSVPSSHSAGTNITLSRSSDYIYGANSSVEQLNPRLGIVMRGSASDCYPSPNVTANMESSRRNFRMRINPARQPDISPSSLYTQGNAIRRSSLWLPNQPSSLIPLNQPLESRPVIGSSSSQNQPHIPIFPGLPRNMPPSPWNGASSSRTTNSSNSISLEERSISTIDETNSGSIPRINFSDHSVLVPPTDIRHLVQDPTNWSSENGRRSLDGNAPNSVVHPVVGPSWLASQNPPVQYPRSSSEVVRRSLFPSGGLDSGGQSSNFPLQRSGRSSISPETSQQPAAGIRGHQQPYMRSAFLIERQSDGVLGVPLSMRSIAAAREGRSRMISEIRNALDLMRRGENLRFEDVFILDQSVFNGGADLHDRHRDMRLDVDNMSYEELLALEERIGNVSTGLNEETVLKCLKRRVHLSVTGAEASMEEEEEEQCCICREEYIKGEELGALDCGHGFHTACIKQWLMLKNLCPICKTTGLVT